MNPHGLYESRAGYCVPHYNNHGDVTVAQTYTLIANVHMHTTINLGIQFVNELPN